MQKVPTRAMLTLTAIIPREDTTALVIRDITEMERIVNQVSWKALYPLRKNYVIVFSACDGQYLSLFLSKRTMYIIQKQLPTRFGFVVSGIIKVLVILTYTKPHQIILLANSTFKSYQSKSTK